MTSPKRKNTTITLRLPYPPSVNKYWRRVGNRTILSRAARTFRTTIATIWFAYRNDTNHTPYDTAHVELAMTVSPPDRRRRDLDNVLKAVCDGLEHAGIIADDSQIRRLYVEFANPTPGGAITITIKPLAIHSAQTCYNDLRADSAERTQTTCASTSRKRSLRKPPS